MEIIEVEELMMSSRTLDLLYTRNLRWVNEIHNVKKPSEALPSEVFQVAY